MTASFTPPIILIFEVFIADRKFSGELDLASSMQN